MHTIFSNVSINRRGNIVCNGILRNNIKCTANFISEFTSTLKHLSDSISGLCNAEGVRGSIPNNKAKQKNNNLTTNGENCCDSK